VRYSNAPYFCLNNREQNPNVRILENIPNPSSRESMTLTLNLPSEVEQYLLQEANQKGISIESVTLQLLTSFILLKQKQTKAVNLIQSWIDEEDNNEQQETCQYLIHALDEDRFSERKLFPIEMKGVTW
jgi:hypothetical protein